MSYLAGRGGSVDKRLGYYVGHQASSDTLAWWNQPAVSLWPCRMIVAFCVAFVLHTYDYVDEPISVLRDSPGVYGLLLHFIIILFH